MSRNQFINSHKSLFWYTPQKDLLSISDKFLIETTFNYGTLDDAWQMFDVLGIDYVSDVFFSMKG